MGEKGAWSSFCSEIDSILRDTLDRDVIIFGSNPGGEFIRWYYETFYNKRVTAVIDRWNLDNHFPVYHLMSLYYLWSDQTVIVNTLPQSKGPQEEFGAIGEDLGRTKWREDQFVQLHGKLYRGGGQDRLVTYYDWLEENFAVDVLTTIRRGEVQGPGAHGYYPTDFRMLYDLLSLDLFDKGLPIMDFGCGKGATMIALKNCGFTRIGGWSTQRIFTGQWWIIWPSWISRWRNVLMLPFTEMTCRREAVAVI